MFKDITVGRAAFGHSVCAVLTHTDAVAVAVNGENELAVCVAELKIGRTQLKKRPQLAAGEFDTRRS